MCINLTIDRGNTLTKLVVWRDSQLLASECFEHTDHPAMAAMASRYGVERAMICSVADAADDIVCALRTVVPDIELLTADTPLPITLGYHTPATLGVDRIAAACGARALVPDRDILVVDAGTAVTYDYVDASGCFVGGNIAPGIGMRLKSLNRFTARLPQVTSQGDTPLWGQSTADAMRTGAVSGVVAETLYYRSHLPETAVVVIGGGDGDMVADRIPFRVIREPHLVTLGLNSILQYQLITHN